MPSFPFTPYPSSWFRLAASRELQPATLKTVHYFGQELVLFRTEAGKVHILDAHCPHLGTHLGLGRVRGEAVECPFHHWQLDGQGQCVAVPYARKVPRAGIRSWPVREVNGQIMLYFDQTGGEASWDFPAFPEFGAPDWSPFYRAHHWRIKTHIQEFGENGMDVAHSPILHGQQTLSSRTEHVRAEGQHFQHLMWHTYRVFKPIRLFSPEVAGPLEVNLFGMGCALNHCTIQVNNFKLDYAYLFFFTPIDEEWSEINSLLAMKKLGNPLLTYLLVKKAIAEGRQTIDQDIPIWETKRYRERPKLCDGDGPIMQFRRWARQFYEPGGTAEEAAAGDGAPVLAFADPG